MVGSKEGEGRAGKLLKRGMTSATVMLATMTTL
jgi:hypothetical protein